MFDPAALQQAVDAKSIPALSTDRQISQVRYSPCGRFLYAAGHDGLVHRWDLTGEQLVALAPIAGHHGWVQTVACAANGNWFVSADSWGELRRTDITGNDTIPTWTKTDAHDGWITGLALSPDESLAVSVGIDRVVRGCSTATGEPRFAWNHHHSEVFSTTFAPDGASVFTGDLDGRVLQTSIADGKVIREFDASALHLVNRLQDVGGARVLRIDQTGKTLLVAGTKPKNGGNVQGLPVVLVFRIEDGSLQRSIELGKEGDVYVTDLVEASDQHWLASVSGNPGAGKLLAFTTTDDKPAFETTKFPNCHSVTRHPDGRRFAVAATNTGSNGNGRPMDKEGKYPGNFSPIHLLTLPAISG